MSLTVEQLLTDAKKLANRLKHDESKADTLITQAKSTYNHVEAMKQYSDDVEKLNEAASQRPHSVLVAGLKRESENMRELRAENRELRIALAEYQNSVRLIMSKYRQHISQLVKANKADISSLHNSHCSHYSQVISDQCTEMERMRRVMVEALNTVENSSEEELKVKELISRLMTENKGLREIIHIYKNFGCQQPIFDNNEEEQEEREGEGEREGEREREEGETEGEGEGGDVDVKEKEQKMKEENEVVEETRPEEQSATE